MNIITLSVVCLTVVAVALIAATAAIWVSTGNTPTGLVAILSALVGGIGGVAGGHAATTNGGAK